MLKQSKIIFIDLDGTLLNDRSEITIYTKEIIKKIVQKGVYVIICSGRSNSDTTEKSRIVKASPIVISDNGASIFNYETNTKIFESKIDFIVLKNIWNFAMNNNINITYNSTYKRFKSKNSNKEAVIISNIEGLEDDITQIVVDTNNYENIKSLENFIKDNYNQLEIKNFWSRYTEDSKEKLFEMDIANKFNSKGNAINELLKWLNIDKKYAMCFGDQMNDLSMFQNCGIKIAMNNGNEQLKRNADFVTTYNNNENGVAMFIEKYIL